jgi:hypothetical protein
LHWHFLDFACSLWGFGYVLVQMYKVGTYEWVSRNDFVGVAAAYLGSRRCFCSVLDYAEEVTGSVMRAGRVN